MGAAAGTSLLVIASNSFAGFAGYLGTAEIPWGLVSLFAALSGLVWANDVKRHAAALLRTPYNPLKARPRRSGMGRQRVEPGQESVWDYLRPAACWAAGEKVRVQEGDFYWGWITPDVVGPFEGGPGTRGR